MQAFGLLGPTVHRTLRMGLDQPATRCCSRREWFDRCREAGEGLGGSEHTCDAGDGDALAVDSMHPEVVLDARVQVIDLRSGIRTGVHRTEVQVRLRLALALQYGEPQASAPNGRDRARKRRARARVLWCGHFSTACGYMRGALRHRGRSGRLPPSHLMFRRGMLRASTGVCPQSPCRNRLQERPGTLEMDRGHP